MHFTMWKKENMGKTLLKKMWVTFMFKRIKNISEWIKRFYGKTEGKGSENEGKNF